MNTASNPGRNFMVLSVSVFSFRFFVRTDCHPLDLTHSPKHSTKQKALLLIHHVSTSFLKDLTALKENKSCWQRIPNR